MPSYIIALMGRQWRGGKMDRFERSNTIEELRVLFDGIHDVSGNDVYTRIVIIQEEADICMNLVNTKRASDRKEAYERAKTIRDFIKRQYHQTQLSSIEKKYSNHKYFYDIAGIMSDIQSCISGKLDYQNLINYLNNVSDYSLYGIVSMRDKLKDDGVGFK